MSLHEIDPAKLIGDKGYDSDGIRSETLDQNHQHGLASSLSGRAPEH